MAQLVYSAIASLDGYVNDRDGEFGWARPDEDVHAFVNDRERPIGTYLYGRRMYETMVAWETMAPTGDAVADDFAELWRAADKVVFSRTLESAPSERTRIERELTPDAVRAIDGRASVGGPGLAADALRAGLVDELLLLTVPIVVGGGTHWLPGDVRLDLELVGERRFDNGFVALDYRVRR